MQCSECGAVVEAELKYCKKCGTKVTGEEDKRHEEDQENLEQQKSQETIKNQAPSALKEKQKKQEKQDSKMIDSAKKDGKVIEDAKKGAYEQAQQDIQLLVRPTKLKDSSANEIATTIDLDLESLKNQLKLEKAQNKKRMKIKEKVELNELKLFFNFMKDFIRKPLMDKGEVAERIADKDTLIYMSVLVAANTLMSVILMEFVLRGLKDLIDIVAYLMSNLNVDIHYLTGKVGMTFIAGDLVMNVGHILVFALLMSVIGNKVMKQEIKWQEVGKYMLAPVGVLTIGKLPVIVVTILNVRLGLVLYVLLVCLMMIIGITALVKRYDGEKMGVYSISMLYLLSVSLNVFAGIKVMMMC